jgi:hypothetical protein
MFVLVPTSDLVDAAQQIGRILVDAKRIGLSQLVRPITAAQKSHVQRTASYGRQHVPDDIADDHCRFEGCAQPLNLKCSGALLLQLPR